MPALNVKLKIEHNVCFLVLKYINDISSTNYEFLCILWNYGPGKSYINSYTIKIAANFLTNHFYFDHKILSVELQGLWDNNGYTFYIF